MVHRPCKFKSEVVKQIMDKRKDLPFPKIGMILLADERIQSSTLTSFMLHTGTKSSTKKIYVLFHLLHLTDTQRFD